MSLQQLQTKIETSVVRIVLMAGALVVSSIVAFGGSQVVQAAGSNGAADPAIPLHKICASEGSGYCLDTGSNHLTVTVSNSNSQPWDIECVSGDACHVTHTYPFTTGSGLNNKFFGDKVVFIQAQNGDCLTETSGGATWHANNCQAAGAEWVIHNFALVSVLFSDTTGIDRYLCSTGVSGNQAVLQGFSTGKCQWGGLN